MAEVVVEEVMEDLAEDLVEDTEVVAANHPWVVD